MPLSTFQLACLGTLVVAYGLELRHASDRPRRLATIVALAVAAWAGEQSCIAIHRFYVYADGWWLRLGHVPLLIPLIWPLVVLSADAVVNHLAPELGRWRRALAVGLVVTFDASLMEVVAVGAGYWTWVEGGYLGVPLMGIVGWGCFAFAATAWRAGEGHPAWLPLVAPAGAHLCIVGLWWLALRWGPRSDLAPAVALGGFAFLAAMFALAVLRARRRRPPLPREVTVARLVATAVFGALLVALAQPLLLIHTALVAVPYVAMIKPSLPTASLAEEP